MIIFLLLMHMGISLLALINVQLIPSRSLPGLPMSYSWTDVSEKVFEQEMILKLKGMYRLAKGIKGVSAALSKDWSKFLFYTRLSNNHKRQRRITKIEQADFDGCHMVPTCFYPLYLLEKLYDETG